MTNNRLYHVTLTDEERATLLTFFNQKYGREDQVSLAVWAVDCAARVLPLFERAYPQDDRPRHAIEACRAWIRTGVFGMSVIRGASLASHAAARDAMGNDAARFAAHADVNVADERNWQSQHLADRLRNEVMLSIIIQRTGRGISVTRAKGEGC